VLPCCVYKLFNFCASCIVFCAIFLHPLSQTNKKRLAICEQTLYNSSKISYFLLFLHFHTSLFCGKPGIVWSTIPGFSVLHTKKERTAIAVRSFSLIYRIRPARSLPSQQHRRGEDRYESLWCSRRYGQHTWERSP